MFIIMLFISRKKAIIIAFMYQMITISDIVLDP